MRVPLIAILAASVTALSAQRPLREAALQAPFEVKPGESVRLPAAALLVRFERVGADSRCPVDTQCVWAGDASVEIHLEQEKAAAADVVLHTMPRFGVEAEYEGLVVRLEALDPQPKSDRPISPEDYRATLMVRRK